MQELRDGRSRYFCVPRDSGCGRVDGWRFRLKGWIGVVADRKRRGIEKMEEKEWKRLANAKRGSTYMSETSVVTMKSARRGERHTRARERGCGETKETLDQNEKQVIRIIWRVTG